MAARRPVPEIIDFKHGMPRLYKTLLTASSMSDPYDPIQFLKNTVMALQGHENLQTVNWYKWAGETEQLYIQGYAKVKSKVFVYNFEEEMESCNQIEKALSFYKKNLTTTSLRKWIKFAKANRKENTHLSVKFARADKYFNSKNRQKAFRAWKIWLENYKSTKAAFIHKLQTLVINGRFKRIITAWAIISKDSKRTKEYFRVLEEGFSKVGSRYAHLKITGPLPPLPSNLLLKIFQYLGLKDLLNCAEVCCLWKSIIQSDKMWSQINFSPAKHWITNDITRQLLQKYRPFVIRLNMRGCYSLTWSSMRCLNECKNLQVLNMAECSNVTDSIVQRIVEGCPCLLFLNLSCTFITNKTMEHLSRNCMSLQYLSLAYCCKVTDEGFQFLKVGKGCHNLVHLNLSGCTQMTVDAFRHISVACPTLKEVVIDDMPTLSDSCLLALLSRCRGLSSLSMLDASHVSDVAFKVIAEAAKLRTFSIEGNNQLTDISWEALCHNSLEIYRLHVAECPRLSDKSLKCVASLRNLKYLNISICNRVTDVGIQYLTQGSSVSKLEELNISYCSRVTDLSVRRISHRLRKLLRLSLSHCKKITDFGLEWLSGSSISSLDITGCSIEDEGLSLLERIPLKKIVLADCGFITDFGIERLCNNIRELEFVDVSNCTALTDAAIRAISFFCRGLVTLCMSGCNKMTDVSVQYLAIGCLYLQQLDVSGCVLLTDNTPMLLTQICPPLTSIKMNRCTGIYRNTAVKLRPLVTHWEYNREESS